MTIVTLTTDLGLRDFYVPSVKGYLYQEIQDAEIVDVTHQVKPFDIAEAAFILGNTFLEFPKGTIHLVSVESDQEDQGVFIGAEIDGHYLLAKDNGLISLITEKLPEKVVKIHEPERAKLKFPLKNILGKAAASIANGSELEEIGEADNDIVMRTHLRPILLENVIRGTVIYVDNFGNVITNVDKGNLERYPNANKVKVNYSKNEYINRISEHYEDVPEGEKLCLFGTKGALEIAINKGNAGRLLGLNVGHTIIIEIS